MTKPKDVLPRDFLRNSNLAVRKSPPWVHSTASSKLFSIIQQEKLLAMHCNVFKGEKLCYLFVGRAAYKGKDALNPESWQLPSAFVMRFNTPPPLKRIHPFDTGAFQAGKLPDYLTTFEMENFMWAVCSGGRRISIGRTYSGSTDRSCPRLQPPTRCRKFGNHIASRC